MQIFLPAAMAVGVESTSPSNWYESPNSICMDILDIEPDDFAFSLE